MLLKELRPALVLLVILSLITGVAYPLAITGLAGALFPKQAAGSLIERDGTVVGSSLIGQAFNDARYFHSRPSATTDTDTDANGKTIDAPYKADASSGSNLGPTSKALVDRVTASAAALKSEAGADAHPVPVDLVTTSASGLDPDITPAAAQFQAARVAEARGLSLNTVRNLIAANTTPRTLGLLGESRVNVLQLNLALDGKR